MKTSKVLITLIVVFLLTLSPPVFAGEIKPQDSIQIDPVPEPILEPDLKSQEPQIIDRGLVDPNQSVSSDGPDEMNAIPEIQSYIYSNIPDIFASLHIEYDKNDRPILILSFTEEVAPKHKEAILALATNPELIVFRLVDFTEQQLLAKQAEVDAAWDRLLAEGIKVHHTSVNVFINRVEIGIEPFNNENIAKIHEAFGSEMIEVVEGQEIHLLASADGAEAFTALEGASEQAASENIGFFQRIAQFFKNIFSWLIK